jgi:thiol-disulfide isomerase/thioredoxin
MSPTRRSGFAAAAILAWSSAAFAQDIPPHLGERGLADYRRFLASTPHRAFVIAPGGAWSSRIDAETAAAALEGALGGCRRLTPQKCVPFAIDERVVFDAKTWSGLLGPYKTRAEAAKAAVGMKPGDRFPELKLTDELGKRVTLANFKGRVVALHFWGSWCAPCRKEMPDLAALRDSLEDEKRVAFVLTQVREPIAASRRWLAEQNLDLPLYDSGVRNESDGNLRIAGGAVLADRHVASVFPSTYLLDRRGVVLLAHYGPVPRWSEYAPFLRDAAERSGR